MYFEYVYRIGANISDNPSEKGYYLSSIIEGKEIKIQVKTVSENIEDRSFSEITSSNFDRIFFLRLDKELDLNGFWVIEKAFLKNLEEKNLIAPNFDNEEKTGSEIFRDKTKCQNVFPEFDKFLKEQVYD
jgi:hypothetical protein